MTPTIQQIVVMALAVGTVSMTITKANIFEWLRNWIETKNDFLADLFSCPYCMSHWIALGLMFLYRPLILDTGNQWPDLFVSWFALVGLGSLVSGAILRIFGGVHE